MVSLQQSFNELRNLLVRGRSLSPFGDDPIFYIVFSPKLMLEVKRQLKVWEAKLKHDGWNVHVFSMADAIDGILKNHDLRHIWLESEKESPFAFEDIKKTLAEALCENDALKNKLQKKLESLKNEEKTVLFVTDLEALHPYLRIGAIEQKLQGSFFVPTVFLYPGTRVGKSTLKFLGIYPEDGNYRSIHIGE